MPSNLSPYQQQGWLASGHLNWSKIPGGPLAIPAPTSSGCFLWDSPDTLSLATLKPVSAVNELLGSSKTILTFLKGTENNKNKTPPKSLQFLTRSGLKKTKKTTKKIESKLGNKKLTYPLITELSCIYGGFWFGTKTSAHLVGVITSETKRPGLVANNQRKTIFHYFETQILVLAGCRASPLHCMWSSPATLFCAAATTVGARPGGDNTNTAPAHSNPAWKSGQYSLEVCAQHENNLAAMASDWTRSSALLTGSFWSLGFPDNGYLCNLSHCLKPS